MLESVQKDQNMARQVKELEEFGCDKIFSEKQTGKNFGGRAIFNDMRKKLRFDDVLVVHDLSCFGRNKQEIKIEWESLMKEEIDKVVLNMPILDTRKCKELEGVGQLITEIVLSLLSWMVDEKKGRIRSAQREGIEIAKEQGKYKEREKKYHDGATGKDKIIYDEIVKELGTGTSVMNIQKNWCVEKYNI